ncbi:MAG: COX15/CtaA family protein [Polyangiaceae bacterium]|nr:COX15/CtaA family protein [Polyangiaceae bacterium]
MNPSAPVSPSEPGVLFQAPQARYARFAWFGLAYTVLVVLFGAVVRVTHSGAGCGQHWPTCNGEILHMPSRVETLIEISHRITSGLALLSAVAVFVASRRVFEKDQLARRAANWVLALMVVECLIGAGLVLGRLVDQDTSVARAVVMPLHLASASILCAAFMLTAWSARYPASLRLSSAPPANFAFRALAAVLFVSMMGAVTALGDTLYPLTTGASLEQRLNGDGMHFLESLRMVHPVLAVLLGALIWHSIGLIAETGRTQDVKTWATTARGALIVQLLVGGLNVALGAPAWMQVVHLGLALGLWLAVVRLAIGACTTLIPESFGARAS